MLDRKVAHNITQFDQYGVTEYSPHWRPSGRPDMLNNKDLIGKISEARGDADDEYQLNQRFDELESMASDQDSQELETYIDRLEGIVSTSSYHSLKLLDAIEELYTKISGMEVDPTVLDDLVVISELAEEIAPASVYIGSMIERMSKEMKQLVMAIGTPYPTQSSLRPLAHGGYVLDVWRKSRGWYMEWTGSTLHVVSDKFDDVTFRITAQAITVGDKRILWNDFLGMFDTWTHPSEEEILLFEMVHPGTNFRSVAALLKSITTNSDI